MKKALYFIIFSLCVSGSLRAEVLFSDEIEVIDRTMLLTQRQLDLQKQMKELMLNLRKTKDMFIGDEHSKQHAGQMVQTAYVLWNLIIDSHMEHLFCADYMEELHFFSSVAAKNSIKRP